METISAAVIGGATTASIGPFVASAAVEQTPVEIGITKDISSFAAYNVIPDASASLDPRLVKLKVRTRLGFPCCYIDELHSLVPHLLS